MGQTRIGIGAFQGHSTLAKKEGREEVEEKKKNLKEEEEEEEDEWMWGDIGRHVL